MAQIPAITPKVDLPSSTEKEIPLKEHMCRVSFLTTLDIYKAYFKSRCTWRTHAESDLVLCSFWKKLLHLCAKGFCNQGASCSSFWWSENFCNQQPSSRLLWVSHVLGSEQKGDVHILKSFGYEVIEGFCCKFIFGDCRV